jgi:hypothetical protein
MGILENAAERVRIYEREAKNEIGGFGPGRFLALDAPMDTSALIQPNTDAGGAGCARNRSA